MSVSSPQPDEPSPALDELYETLTEVQAHLGQHHQERQSLLSEIESMQRDLQDQRAAAAQAGERATYDRLSEDLAKLTRAWRVASEDPDADPLEEYQPDEQAPDAPTTAEEPTAPTTTPADDGRPPSSDETPAGESAAAEPVSAEAETPAGAAADTGEPSASEASAQAPAVADADEPAPARRRPSSEG